MIDSLGPGGIHPSYHNNLNDPTPAQKQQLSNDLERLNNVASQLRNIKVSGELDPSDPTVAAQYNDAKKTYEAAYSQCEKQFQSMGFSPSEQGAFDNLMQDIDKNATRTDTINFPLTEDEQSALKQKMTDDCKHIQADINQLQKDFC